MTNNTIKRPTLYAMSGPPASGKSTYVDKLHPDIVRISPDEFVYDESGIYNWTPKRAGEAWDKAYHILRQNMKKGVDCVFDSTLTSTKARRKFLQKISSFEGFENYKLVAVSLPVLPLEVLLQRNAARTFDRRVPESSIKNMLDSFSQDGPTEEEGWDKIIQVK